MDTEHFITIITAMYEGDLHPLAAAIIEGQTIDSAILWYLAGMISDGSIVAKNRITVRRPRGRPKQGARDVRNGLAVLRFEELRKSLSSEAAFQKAATDFKMTEASLRTAVTASRSNKK